MSDRWMSATVLPTFLLAGCVATQQADAPNDTVSRALNEMKATPKSLPPPADPRDARMADLERRLADREAELAKLRGAAGDLSDANRRITDLDRQLADRDRELAALRSSAGDASVLAGKLPTATGDLDQAKQRLGELERQLAERDEDLGRLRSMASERDSLAGQLNASSSRTRDLEGQLAALRGSAGDASKLATDLSAAKQENASLAAHLASLQAGMQAGAGDKDRLAEELAAAKQRAAALEEAQLAGLQGASGDKDKLAAELAAAEQRIAELERQLADRDAELAKLRGNLSDEERELARLKGELSAEMAKLKGAERGLVKALKPEIDKGNITVDLNNERLLINLASAYLFGLGEDQLKPAGVDALKRVGTILKDYPEYNTDVAGHTDNLKIRSSLKKRFPTNKELSQARAASAVTALTDGGMAAGSIKSAGYADTKPVAPNGTDAGRQKNRRVEVRVTPKS